MIMITNSFTELAQHNCKAGLTKKKIQLFTIPNIASCYSKQNLAETNQMILTANGYPTVRCTEKGSQKLEVAIEMGGGLAHVEIGTAQERERG